MIQSDARSLINPIRGYIRIFLMLVLLFLAIGGVALLILLLPGLVPNQPSNGLRVALLVTMILCVPVALAMLISALFTIPPARRADRLLDEFRDGRYLVKWTYSPPDWHTYVDMERRRLLTIKWWLVALILAPVWIAGGFGGWSAGTTLASKVGWSLVLPVVTLILGGIALVVFRFVARR